MARYLGPRLRITRRLGHLSGLTRKKPTFKPLNPSNPLGPRKIIPPGQHGRNKTFKKKPYESCEYDYLIRLKLKQRLRFHYGLTERQLVRYVQQAKKIKGSTGRVLLSLLEMRLDNIVFRLHMAPTIRAARQLINHGHILVNKKKVTIPSYQCEPKDVITVAPKIRSMELVSRFLTEFDREKARYQRLLNILEYGKRGITMPTKELYSTKKDLFKTTQNRKTQLLKTNKIQSLKIGSVLNVQLKQQGRYEAEAIANAYGKMIIIHPLFIGKQSINKKIRVIIYKKSQNNKILYAYPVNPFYLRLENIRQLNSLDVARIFGRYTGRSFNRSGSKVSLQKQGTDKRTLSSLILINGAKILPKNLLNRRQRFNIIGKEKNSIINDLNKDTVKNELTNQSLTNVFIRIIAAKCLNNKLRQNNIDSNNQKNNINDPVSYREKFVYTQTSRTLRQFGTRFYAQILKDQAGFKNVLTEQQDEKSFKTQSSPRTNFSKNSGNVTTIPVLELKNVSQVNEVENFSSISQNTRVPKSKSNQLVIPSNNQKTKYFENNLHSFQDLKNENSSLFKITRGFPELLNLVHKQSKNKPNELSFTNNVPVFFRQSIELISKLASLKQQRNFKNETYNQLKDKLFTNLLVKANNLFLTQNARFNFIFVLFYKVSRLLDLNLKHNELFNKENFILLGNNIQDLFYEKKLKTTDLMQDLPTAISLKYSEEVFLFNLKTRAILSQLSQNTKIFRESTSNQIQNSFTNYHIELLSQKITNNLNLVLLLDRLKNTLQSLTNFSKDLFSADIMAIESSLGGVSIDLLSLKTTRLINQIISNIISTVKTLTMMSKLIVLKSLMSNVSEEEFIGNYKDTLKNVEKKLKSSKIYKQVINFFMLSLPKSVYISEYDSTLSKLITLYNNNQILDIDFYKKNSKALNSLSLGFVDQQKIQLVTSLDVLTKFNMINLNTSLNITTIIKSNLINHKVYQTLLTNFLINKFKINELNKKINTITLIENFSLQNLVTSPTNSLLSLTVDQNLLQKQTNFDISLLSQLNQKLIHQELLLQNVFNSSNLEFVSSTVIIERKIFAQKIQNLLIQKKIFKKILNQKNKIYSELNLLKQYNLLTLDNLDQVQSFLQNKFSLLEKLVFFSNVSESKNRFSSLNIVIQKILNQMVQKLAAHVSFWKMSFLQKQNNLIENELSFCKQIILENITNFKLKFTQNLINKFIHCKKEDSGSLTNFSALLTDSLIQQTRVSKVAFQYRLIVQIYTIYIVDTLKTFNLIKDQSFIQIFSEIREKFSTKKLLQTNIVLTKFLNFLKTNGDIRVINLDNFVQTIMVNSSSLNIDLASKLLKLDESLPIKTSLQSKSKNNFWKQIVLDLTPLKIKNGLDQLKNQNLFLVSPGSYISQELEKLTSLFNQTKLLKLSLNKQYIKQKLQIIKNILVSLCENLNFVNIQNISLFNNNNLWSLKKLLGLELLQQSKFKLLLYRLENQKLKLISKLQKLSLVKSFGLDTLNSLDNNGSIESLNLIFTYLENQFTFIVSKLLIKVGQDSNLFFTGKIHETENLLKNLKLYLLRYQFINQTVLTNQNLSRINLLRKQRSIFINKNQYQALKTSWEEFLIYKNSNSMKTVLENNYPILVYLKKELAAKLNYKLLQILEKSSLNKNEYNLLNNTIKRLTNNELFVNSSYNWISTLKNLKLSNINQAFLTKKILSNYSGQNIPVYYNLGTNNNYSSLVSQLDLVDEKEDWLKILTDLKYKLNLYKLHSLNSQGWIDSNKKTLQFEVKAFYNQIFNSMSVIENAIVANGESSEEVLFNRTSNLKTLKRSPLKYFSKNLKKLIYFSKLNTLNERQLITEEQFLLFKQNYENLVLLVRKTINRLLVLNARRKWKFINYRKYETLSQAILNNLSLKINELLSKNNRETPSLKSNLDENPLILNNSSAKIIYLKNNEQSLEANIIQNFAQFHQQNFDRTQVLDLLATGKQSFSIQTLVQETLQQLLENSESNVSLLISRFIDKSKFIMTDSQNIDEKLKISSVGKLKTINPFLTTQQLRDNITVTLQYLISLQKQIKVKGPWVIKDEQTKKVKQIIIQNFVNNLQKTNIKTQKTKVKEINLQSFSINSSALNFPIEQKLNTVLLLNDLSTNHNYLNQVLKLQSQLHKLYFKKLTSQVLPNDSRLSLLIRSNFVELSQSNQILSLSNLLNSSTSLNLDFNTAKIECELILQNLINQKIRRNLELDLKQFSNLNKSESMTSLLSQKLYNQIKMTVVKLLSNSFKVRQIQMSYNNSFFNNSNNIVILSKFGFISETMYNQLIQKIKGQIQKQKIETIIFYLAKLQKQFSLDNLLQNKKSGKLWQTLNMISVLSQLYELKQSKAITEKQYLSIKQKLKQLTLLSALNAKLIEFNESAIITDENVIEFRQQIIQKIQQKIKKAKTLSKFQFYLNSVSEVKNFTIKNKKSRNSIKKSIESIIPNFLSRGRWAQVTLKQLAKQKLITLKQETKISNLLAQQTTIKVEKLRNLVRILNTLQQFIQNQNSLGFKTSTYDQQILTILPNLLRSVNGAWKLVILKQLRKQELISQNLFNLLKHSNPALNEMSQDLMFDSKQLKLNSFNSQSLANNLVQFGNLNTDKSLTQFKLQTLLQMYHKQILKLTTSQTSRSIRKIDYDTKLKSILLNILLLLEKGGIKAFKVIYNTKWIIELTKVTNKTTLQKRNLNLSIIREFNKKYESFKTQYLSLYQKLELNSKINLFNQYKSFIIKLCSDLEIKVNNNNNNILDLSRLANLNKSGLITSQQYLKLKVLLKTAIQRLTKLDQIFITQNLYQVNNDFSVDKNVLSNSEILNLVNKSVFNDQYLQLQNKIFTSYLKVEYKQVEKNIIKQKFLQQKLNLFNLNQKSNKLLKTRLKRKLALKKEQFTGYFQQFINLLDSRYKGEGRNRRGPRINNIYRQLNQKLAFDPTLTKKFGTYLQMFIDKRFGPALPIPAHLELKRWKIKNSQLIQKSDGKETDLFLHQRNQKYLILPVGIVHDISARRSVGLPILERLIVEYYSRN